VGEGIDILIVEDSPTQALKLQLLLEQQGYRVRVAINGKQGLDMLQKGFYPVVITDWVMPEMDGFQFCQAVRSQEFPGYVYLILLTAKDTRTDIVAGLEAGADDCLIKPVDSAELIARLNTAKRIIRLEHSLRRRNEEIALLSITDPLTRTYNRRYLNEQLPNALNHAFRYSQTLSIAICDIDHFKSINDCYGHQIGDHVLQEFAGGIRNVIREGADWVVRYGGEEFLIVLPETDLIGAHSAAERYRLLTAATPILHEDKKIKITASFGVACVYPTEEGKKVTVESLISAADQCMYRAKQEGRNRSFTVSLGLKSEN